MYCGNCGEEIDRKAVFCPKCGVKTEFRQGAAVKTDSFMILKKVKIGIGVAVIITAVFIGLKVFSYIQSIPSEGQIQTAANNVQNGALVASDGTWIYYNDRGLCKMRLRDGSKQSVVSSDLYAEHLFCIGNKLYIYSFPGYYILDGTDGKNLGFSVFNEDCFQADGMNFYISDLSDYEESGVYSVKAGNKERNTKISDIHPTRLLLQGEYLYVISGFNSINGFPNENYGTWRMDKNGKHLISIFDYCPYYLVFSGEKIYYTNEESMICSANLDGSNEIVFEDAVVGRGLNVSEEYIFYIDSDSHTIHRMNKDGSNKIELNTDRSSKLNIIDEWIFYENEDYEDEIYKMSFDGSYNQPIY